MKIIGKVVRKFSGSLRYAAEMAIKLKQEGYQIDKVTAKRNWPIFWTFIYKVRMTKEVLADVELLADVNDISEELSKIKNNLGIK